jgi:hypothetical protein
LCEAIDGNRQQGAKQQQVTDIHGVIRCGNRLVRPRRNRHRGPSRSD